MRRHAAGATLGIAVGQEGLSVAWNQPKDGVATSYYRRIPLPLL